MALVFPDKYIPIKLPTAQCVVLSGKPKADPNITEIATDI